MVPEPNESEILGDAERTTALGQDTPCRYCSYNLRGLPRDGRCPECGTAISQSLHEDLLVYSAPRYVRRLAFGVRVMFWSMLAEITVGIAGEVVAAVGVPAGRGVAILASLAGSAAGYWGTWLISTRDPSGLGEVNYRAARRATRVGAAALLAVDVALNTAELYLPGVVSDLADAVGGLVILAFFWIQLFYMGRLARRMSDTSRGESVGRHANRLRTLVVVVAVSGMPALVLSASTLNPATPNVSVLDALTCGLACVFLPAALLLVIFTLVFYYRFARALESESRRAEMTWGANSSSQ